MRIATLALSSALLLFVAGLLAVQHALTFNPYTTAAVDTTQASNPDGSTDETKAYAWIAQFALSRLK